MKKTRFIASDKAEQQFAAALRKNVNNYFKENGISPRANTAVVFQTLNMLALYITPFVLVLTVPMAGWLALVMSVMAGIGLAGIGMCVMHGGAHDAISSKKWVNGLLGGTMNLLGNSVFTWKVQHNMLHHTFTNISGLDRDIATKGPIRLSEHTELKPINRFQFVHAFFFYGLMTLSMMVKDFSQLFDYRRQGILEKQKVHFGWALTKMILIKIVHLSLFIGLPILLTDFAWWQVLIGWFTMHWTGGFILSVIFQLAHVVEDVDQPLPSAEGLIENDWVVHEMHTTANFARNNHLLNWYIGGLNFQIEHHLFPHICHIHYPKIAPIVEATAKEYGIPYILKPTLMDAIVSHARKLKELGHVPSAV
ncbi:MAG TPA: acyl-CoA desaturase [Bacteroidia bacterium]|nr:acyl-CoA desaturase [Bacteroidia bacterium]